MKTEDKAAEVTQYVVTKEQCQERINGVCTGCGGKLEPIETVDNSNNPTFWAGCLICSKFCSGVSSDIYETGKKLFESGYIPYSHMDIPSLSGEDGYREYYRHSQIAGAVGLVSDVLRLHASQVSASKDREIEELKIDLDNATSEIHQLKDRISDQSKTIEELKELLMDCFSQACSIEESGTKYYDHMCLSTYEATQEFLVRHGVIKQEECYRP